MAIISSSFQNIDSRSRGRTETKKKVKKLRSIKLSKLPSLKPSASRAKSRFDWLPLDLPSNNSSPTHSDSIEVSNASPNYMKATSSSHAKKGISQGGSELEDISVSSPTCGSSASPPSCLNRDSRIKGGTEFRKTLKKSRSKKIVNFGGLRPSRRLARSRFDRPSLVMPDDVATLQHSSSAEVSDASPNYLRTSHFQASPPVSESSFGSSHHSRRSSNHSQWNSAFSSQKSMQTLTRTTSLRTVRILKSKTGYKSKRPSTKKRSEIFQDLSMSVERATCSSSLKDLKFHEQVVLHPGESESERISVVKVCPYHHCSLNGHCHAPVPPLKPLLTRRRRSLKSQHNMKAKGHPTLGLKGSGDREKKSQTNQMVPNAAPEVLEGTNNSTALSLVEDDKSFVEIYAKPRAQFFRGAGEEIQDSNLAEIMPGKTLNPKKTFQENNNQIRNGLEEEEDILEAKSELIEKGCAETKEDRHIFGTADLDSKSEFIGGFTAVRDSEASIPARETFKTQFPKEKHFSMWQLIHQHMVSGLAVESGKQPLKGAGREEQVSDANRLHSPKSSCLYPELSNSDMNMEDNDAAIQEIELRKIYAIKLVREAIEKILLPEVQDQLSDDQSVASDVISDQELLEKNPGEARVLSISTSTDTVKDCFRECDNNKMEDISLNQREVNLAGDNILRPKEDKTATLRNKSDKQSLKNRSNLKKWILLKRFVKALEKVRKFNSRKPKHLPLEHEQEAEKVCLRHQMTNEKKNAEEWMLDYALQQAVSQLAPTQKRKVALLVKAFETVVPPQEDQYIQVTSPKLKDIGQKCSCIKCRQEESVYEANDADKKVEESVVSNIDHGNNNPIISDELSDGSHLNMPTVKDSQLCSKLGLESDDMLSSCEKVPLGEKAQEVHEDTISGLNSDLSDVVPELSGKKVAQSSGEIGKPSYITNSSAIDGDGESIASNSMFSSASDCDPQKQLTVFREVENRESEPEHAVLQQFPSIIGSEPDYTANGAYKTQLDRQNQIRMWHMIYQHVVSGIAAKVGSQLLFDGAEEEQGDNAKLLPEIKTSGFFHDCSKTDHDENYQRFEFSQSDAVKLIQEAVDEILHPEVQDDASDNQSINSDIIQDQELLESNQDDIGEQSILTSTDSSNDRYKEGSRRNVERGMSMDQGEKGAATDRINSPEERDVSGARTRPVQQKSKNWSKLKKVILLRRSIMALEKVRKLNSQPPQSLPLAPDPKTEKVDLRHQMMDERKRAEQWMLDYAVQHIVTKLTPARKRRVAMLVEAFEAVVPLPEV